MFWSHVVTLHSDSLHILELTSVILLFIFVLMVLKIEPRALGLLDKRFTTELPAQLDGHFWLLSLYSSRSQWLFPAWLF